jgi:Mitochondrial protein Pet127
MKSILTGVTSPGVYHLQDPRSRVFNFDPCLGSIMPVTEFDFDALKQYITSSKDETLLKLAAKEGKKYVGSSSSMTSVLSHFHYLLSAWRGINAETISIGFPDKLRTFTRLLRAPAAMFLHYRDGVYAIDADKEFDSANILMNLGKSMEKLLTLPKEEFERYRRSSANRITAKEEQSVPESYHYSTLGDFIMRSQLDAHDSRLPGTGMFDLKTRAVVSIRMDAKNFEHGLGYEIKHRFGGYESYEREFFDMIRAAFLKYSLQVRVGRMDGIFVAFHNIERIFGFQYISLPEMDLALHGQTDTTLGDKEFQLSLALWSQILDRATARFPKRSLRFHFETRDATVPYMLIFAEPVSDEDIEAIQTKNKAEVEAFQRRILNLESKLEDEALTSEETEHQPAGEAAMSEPSEDVVQMSDSSEAKPEGGEEEATRDLFALILTVSNKVNSRPVVRPKMLKAEDNWTIEHRLSEMAPGPKVWELYKQCQRRRQKALAGRGEDETELASNFYIRRLREISQEGRKWRAEQDQFDRGREVVVLES